MKRLEALRPPVTIPADKHAALEALAWHVEQDCATPIGDTPVNRLAVRELPQPPQQQQQPHQGQQPARRNAPAAADYAPASTPLPTTGSGSFAALQARARDMAAAATTLDELKAAIAAFDGIEIKKHAMNMVFADGHPKARVMVIGEAPGADEDRQGKPFVGVSGQLLDKMFACIGLSRGSDDAANALYISNILNWRPPGNRTPTQEEMELSLPFIARHVALVKPDFIVMAGATSAKTLLATDQPISRLRGQFFTYQPQVDVPAVKAMATFHPSFLLRTPQQKRKSWADLMSLQDALQKP